MSPDHAGTARSLHGPEVERSAFQDRRLVARIRAGDVPAFSELFTEYHPRLCRYAEGFLRSPDAAKEAVSDLFLWVWEHRQEWRVEGSLAGYLFRAVRNRCLDQLKRERRVRRFQAAALLLENAPGMAERSPTPLGELEFRELTDLVERAIAALPDRPREAFRLQRQHGLTYAEIAAVMEISVSTVEKHMMRALKELRGLNSEL